MSVQYQKSSQHNTVIDINKSVTTATPSVYIALVSKS